jgi:hypothetical protein
VNPSPQAIALIRSRVTNWNQSNDAILTALNAPSIANPKPQTQKPKKLKMGDVLGTISRASKGKLIGVAFLPAIRDAINTQDRTSCLDWLDVLNSGGIITDPEKTDLTTLINSTELDPSWVAQISWAEATIGRLLDILDIIAAHP